MPYIGRNHIAGDHTSNFKVLDDISSYTATFDGSATAVVSTADETIRIPEHRFIQGQRVTYSNGGGSNIGGLTSGTAYFVTFDTANTIKLATTLANANSNTNINLSSVGGGTSHTLNAAFDGINTQFKATHNNGDAVNINNSSQLQIAINNVIQKPNENSSYTEGFRVVDSRKIQFKTAPTVDDIFWGSILANTIETFDISDLKIDNFTGDGSTTQFTLTKDVPNNQSILVTLDGVTQHASDNSTARSYSLVTDSIIQFTAAPGNGVEIQVRHLGFAGASTGDVSGFYGRTGNVVLGASDHITTGDITSRDITPRNINASGIVTASTFDGSFTGNVVGTSATFTGNLSVGGVLTYEDVTNVDSVGIITAQKDIHVGAGLSVVGVTTFSGITDFDNIFRVGDVGGFPGSTQSSRITKKDNHPAGLTFDHGSSPTLEIGSKPGEVVIGSNSYGNAPINFKSGVTLGTLSGGTTQMQVTPTGVNITKDLDVDGHTNLDNVSIAGVTTSSGGVRVPTNGSNSANYISVGSGDNLKLYHDGSNGGSLRNGTGNLEIQANAVFHLKTTQFNVIDNTHTHYHIRTFKDDRVELYHNNVKRLETSAKGIQVGTGVTIESNGQATYTGIVTASSFRGDGSQLTGISVGPGTGESYVILRNQSNPPALSDTGRNIIIGVGAAHKYGNGSATGGNENVFIGYGAGYNQTGGDGNVYVGAGAGNGNQTSTGNVYVGQEAGRFATGQDNICIGRFAGNVGGFTGSNNLVFGYNSDPSSANVSNEITLGGSNISHFRMPGIGVSFGRNGATIAGVVTATSFSGDGSNLTGISAGTSLSGSTNNTVCTVTGANAIQGEANFTYNSTLAQLTTDTSTNNTELIRLQNSHTDGKMTVMGFNTDGLGYSQTRIYGGNDNTGAASQQGDSGAGKFKVTITNPSGTHQEVIYAENDASSKFVRLSTDGNERLRINHLGDVGIGTDSPESAGLTVFNASEARLQVRAAPTGSNGIVALRADGTNTQMGTWSNHDIHLVRNSTIQATVNSNGIAFPSGKGIDFSATADGTGSNQAELFDDYEEGSWTPAVASGNASFSGMTGRYTKVGRNVSLWFRINGGGSYSGSSALQISGLPFTNNTSGIHPVGTSEFYKIDFARDYSDHCTPYLSGQNLQWLRNNSGGGSGNYLTINLFYTSAAITGWIQYYTNS